MASGTDEVYVKLGPTEKDYAREVRAYEHAARFAPHEVPRLLAADPDLRAIMTSPVGKSCVWLVTRVHQPRPCSRRGCSSGARAGGGAGERGGIPGGVVLGESSAALARLTAVVVPVSRRACSPTSR